MRTILTVSHVRNTLRALGAPQISSSILIIFKSSWSQNDPCKKLKLRKLCFFKKNYFFARKNDE